MPLPEARPAASPWRNFEAGLQRAGRSAAAWPLVNASNGNLRDLALRTVPSRSLRDW